MKGFCKFLDVLYTVCLAIFALLLTAMLLIQIFCLFIMNGPASVWITEFIIPKAGVVSSVMVVAVIVLSYLRHTDIPEE